MQFKLSFKPEKYELSIYELLKVTVKAINDEETSERIQSIKNIVPNGFKPVQMRSVSTSSFNSTNNELKVNVKLNPGESKILASLLLIPMTSGKTTYSPTAMLEEQRKIGERALLVSPAITDIDKPSLFTLCTDDVIEAEPGNVISTTWSLNPPSDYTVKYVLLLNVLPPDIIKKVKETQDTFSIGKEHLLFLKPFKTDKKAQLPFQVRIKRLQKLKPLVTKELKKQMAPTLIAKTDQGIIKTPLNTSYSFKINTKPCLLPPQLTITNVETEKNFFKALRNEKKTIYLEPEGKIKYTLTLRKESSIPLTGIRITNFLPKAFTILETQIDTEHQKDRSYIQIPRITKKRFPITFRGEAPAKEFRSLIDPEIYCNEVNKKVRLDSPPLVKVCPKNTINKTCISPVSWTFIPEPPFSPETHLRSKLVMENPGSFPVRDLSIAFELPSLKFEKIIKSSSLLERKKSTLYGEYIPPHERIEVEILFKSGQAKEKKISGKCKASWHQIGESDTHTSVTTKQYTIREAEPELLDKLQFWKS